MASERTASDRSALRRWWPGPIERCPRRHRDLLGVSGPSRKCAARTGERVQSMRRRPPRQPAPQGPQHHRTHRSSGVVARSPVRRFHRRRQNRHRHRAPRSCPGAWSRAASYRPNAPPPDALHPRGARDEDRRSENRECLTGIVAINTLSTPRPSRGLGQVAQLVEHRIENAGVAGSSPALPTFRIRRVSPASATTRLRVLPARVS